MSEAFEKNKEKLLWIFENISDAIQRELALNTFCYSFEVHGHKLQLRNARSTITRASHISVLINKLFKIRQSSLKGQQASD